MYLTGKIPLMLLLAKPITLSNVSGMGGQEHVSMVETHMPPLRQGPLQK